MRLTRQPLRIAFSRLRGHLGFQEGPGSSVVEVSCEVSSVATGGATQKVFLLYDLYVRREFNAKKDLLESRRQFMRFVSHEVIILFLVYVYSCCIFHCGSVGFKRGKYMVHIAVRVFSA